MAKQKKLKILELSNFSAGICGVWQRVKQESLLLSKKYDVMVFSSNAVKGSEEIAKESEKIGKIEIKRFPFKKLGGESFLSWKFEQEALKFKPNIIIAHAYRHLHTTKALKIAKKINAKCFLVTHAPFIEDNLTRSFFGKIAVNFYDKFISPLTINKFDKVIAITKWEMPYLLNLGCRKDKIIYIPNGIPEEFFELKKQVKEENKILFLGRISPIKNLEILIKAIKDLPVKLTIIGPADEHYKKHLLDLIKKSDMVNVEFLPAVYDLKRKIQIIDKYKIFVLPSKSEAMPQSLIESMARGKLVISSNTQGGKEIIKDGKNGFLFEIGNEKKLVEKILFCLNKKNKKKIENIKKEARKTVEKFKESKIVSQIEKLF